MIYESDHENEYDFENVQDLVDNNIIILVHAYVVHLKYKKNIIQNIVKNQNYIDSLFQLSKPNYTNTFLL